MQKKKTSLKKRIFALLAVGAILAITAIPCFASDTSTDTLEVGRVITTQYNVTSGYDNYEYIVNNFDGFFANGNNISFNGDPMYSQYYMGIEVENASIIDFVSSSKYDYSNNVYPYNKISLFPSNGTGVNDTITLNITDYYVWMAYDTTTESLIQEGIEIDFFGRLYEYSNLDYSNATVSIECRYYELLNGDLQPKYVQYDYPLATLDIDDDENTLTVNLSDVEFFGEPDWNEETMCLYYIEYFFISFDFGDVDSTTFQRINVEYALMPEIEFEYNGEQYTLTTQNDFNNFRLGLYSSNDDGGYDVTIPSEFIRPYADWIASAVGGFFSIQLFPGFYLGGLIVTIIAFALVMWWLKMFGGG